MRSNPALFSEEEMGALNMILEESRAEIVNPPQTNGDMSGDEGDGGDVSEGEGDADDSAEWTYERLLEIGQLAGGNYVRNICIA